MSKRAFPLPLTLIAGAFGSLLWLSIGLLGACGEEPPPNPTGGQGGAGGEGGGCPMTPQPVFTVTISTAEGAALPSDTSLMVTWSEGEEPVFQLNDQSTWSTSDEANVVCLVDPEEPPPTDLTALVCHLWTSGATEIEIKAEGYSRHNETLVPMLSEKCDAPIPTEVSVTLAVEMDGGPPP